MRRNALVALAAAVLGALVATPVAVYASHQFADVPNSNIFHADIDWLADAGVTRGCNPPANDEFCPKDVVTRETMAAFLHRLAVNQVVDAGTVQGLSPEDLEGRNASEPLQSGETVFGIAGGELLQDGPPTHFSYVSLPAPAPVALDSSHVNTAAGFDADPECSGSSGNPTAPPGKVCIYFSQHDPEFCELEQGFVGPDLGLYGFVFAFDVTSGTGNCIIQAVWVYTAP